MPPGVPVATVGIDAAKNAGILAAQILAVGNAELTSKMIQFKQSQKEAVLTTNAELQSA